MPNNKFFLILLILLSYLSISSVITYGWGPNTHVNMTLQSFSESQDTLIKHIIMNNLDGCYSGLVYADVGIFYYYTNFKLYKGLHNYNTVDELLRLAKDDRDRAFAYCFKIHLAEDSISHNYFVPAAIRSTKLPNYIIHPIVELKIEGKYLNPIANRLMERHKEFDELVTKATGKDWSGDAERLNIIIGGGNFYSQAYIADSTTWIGRTQNAIYKYITPLISDKSVVDYYKLSVNEAKGVLRGETNNLDPSGENSLREADSQTALYLYGTTFLAILLVFFISWRKKWI